MEIWDIYDKDRNLKDKFFTRGDNNELEEGDYELITHVAIFNEQGEMLIQKRSITKKKFANLGDISAGGHSIRGEDSYETMQRELYEELGYSHDFSKDRPCLTVHYDKGFDDIYILKDYKLNIDDLKLEPTEVQSVTWASLSEIKQLIEEGKFIDYCPGYIESIFFMKDNHSLVKKSIT